MRCATGGVPYRMLYIWFSPDGSKSEGIRKMSAPASTRWARAGSKARTYPASAAKRRARPVNIDSMAGSPVPRAASCTRLRARSGGMVSRSRSKPFWRSRRETTPSTGTPGRSRRPKRWRSAAVLTALPSRSPAS